MSRQDTTNALDLIRQDLNGYVGQEIYLRANKGRKKCLKYKECWNRPIPRFCGQVQRTSSGAASHTAMPIS